MDKLQIHSQLCGELNEMYERKNADYGDSFSKSFQEYGMVMPLIRIEDKFNRLKSLFKNKSANYESVEDTLKDLANYCLLTLIELEVEKSNKKCRVPEDNPQPCRKPWSN